MINDDLNSDEENNNLRVNINNIDINTDKKNDDYDILEDLKKERENYDDDDGNEDNILNDLKKNRDENQKNENDDNNKIQNEINTNEIEYPEDFYQKQSGFNRIYLNSFKKNRNTKTLLREDDKVKEDILDLYV